MPPPDPGLVDPGCLCINWMALSEDWPDSLHAWLSASPASLRGPRSGAESVLVEAQQQVQHALLTLFGLW